MHNSKTAQSGSKRHETSKSIRNTTSNKKKTAKLKKRLKAAQTAQNGTELHKTEATLKTLEKTAKLNKRLKVAQNGSKWHGTS